MRLKHALYLRVSTVDQHPESRLNDLRLLAGQRGLEIVEEYTDRFSGVKARRPGLDQLLADARRGRFQVVRIWAFDRDTVFQSRQNGQYLARIAKAFCISRARAARVLKQAETEVSKGYRSRSCK